MAHSHAHSARRASISGVSLAALAACFMTAPAASAQTSDGSASAGSAEEETIIVSARKREEALDDTPVAVSVATAADIARDDLDELEDITLRTPGVQFTEQSTLVAGRAR